MPMDRTRYPKDWRAISLRIRERADWRCEWCGVPQGAPTKSGGPVVLTVAHLNHDPSDCQDTNLAALCQSCHIRYDAAQHAANARATRTRKRRAAADAAGQQTFGEEPSC
jgi:5-methylcytosine-specific restriction endonuclease McrA